MNSKYIKFIVNYKQNNELTPNDIEIADELIKKLESEENLTKIFKWIIACNDSLSKANKFLEIIFKLFFNEDSS